MKYAVITCTDGNFLLRSEHSDRNGAIVAYDKLHASLINDTSTEKAVIRAVDEQFDVIDGKYFDVITHAPVAPEPVEEEPTEE